MSNQNPEQKARDAIDSRLETSGWIVQAYKNINWQKGLAIAVKEYPTEVGPADYMLFIDKIPVGIIEAKKDDEGYRLTVVEEQSRRYANSKLKYMDNPPLRFCYEATGLVTRFTDYNDPKPCSREVFSFHSPSTLQAWLKETETLRDSFKHIPDLKRDGSLRECQFNAIANLEKSFKTYQPRALIQMATGAGKTVTAITSIYRLLKFTNAKRVLFLVDRENLGLQAAQEFETYKPVDDNRNFKKLYSVVNLSSNTLQVGQVYISTIQRLYSILRGEELTEDAENLDTESFFKKSIDIISYNQNLAPEFFDFIIIDECHRSIYNKWKQVLDYFDGFIIGLTATPDKRTFGFFNQNLVSEYTHEKAVLEGVNVGYDIYTIETDYQNGAKIKADEFVNKREKLTRKTRWEQIGEDIEYSEKDLDRSVVNPSQITAIVKEFKKILFVELFPGRKECPKTLIFAKSDSHADDIIQTVRTEFGEGNDFCKKITYKDEDPKAVLTQFRNGYNPRVAVTVDMVATGTDIKAIECLIFMRDVKSKNYYEQMLGRGTRTLKKDDLLKVTPSAPSDKTGFIVIDAVGVSTSLKTDMRPLEKKAFVPFKELLKIILLGSPSEDVFSSVASRLIRLDKQLLDNERDEFNRLAKDNTALDVAKSLVKAYDPDAIEDKAREDFKLDLDEQPSTEQLSITQGKLIKAAKSVFTGELNTFIENVQKIHEQIIDTVNVDSVINSEWNQNKKENAEQLVKNFTQYIRTHKDEITALSILYNEPHRRKEITFKMINDLYQKLQLDKPHLDPSKVYNAYTTLENSKGGNPKTQLTTIVSLIRRITAVDAELTNYQYLVDKNFQEWVFRKQSGALKFSKEQMEWLHMIKDHVTVSLSLDSEDLDMQPFNNKGGLKKMYHLFGLEMNNIISELNEALMQ